MTHQTHRTDVQMRFGDTDALGHVNNASFATYAEVARLEFLAIFGAAVRSLILANLSIDFRRQVKMGETLHVETCVEKVGNTSVTLEQTIFADGERAADVRSVVVYFDYANGRAQALSSEMRARLQPYVKRDGSAPRLM